MIPYIIVGEDELGWYYQVPVTDPRVPGLTFMDRVHDVRLEERRAEVVRDGE